MSITYTAAVVGCGGIARAHAQGYADTGRCEVVACADIFMESAIAFSEQFNVPHVFTDYKEMMEQIRPDLVSVCTHHHLHHSITMELAAYKPKAIYCEKPMALTMAEANEMAAICEENDVMLIIGHQRRYGAQYAAAKELLDQGQIGELHHMECYAHPWTSLLVDGTHSIDLLRYYNNDNPISWVFGQVDASGGSFRFGHPNESASLAMFGFDNGVRATLTTGGFSRSRSAYPARDAESLGSYVAPSGYHRIVLHGTTGRIEIDGDDVVNGRPIVRIHRGGQEEGFKVPFKSVNSIERVVTDLIHTLEDGKPHLLNAQSGRAALEVIVAIFQSAEERKIVYLPLTEERNPLFELLKDQIKA
ncbi:Gfo/Idh/MocA family protein [Paenibacillus spongiae]|uniref:Gfo/Idh/MocA family oxidoreductase n=1 Tax=Paenibacillus spongiae TaxID=2909671 RepID=A0ABY5SDW5_9BACL|nr:Gfo/Idh/MocA family oxidoreductase [Paenibacillus spongiae]UVI32147.1 Gfo/Idh/MocA family oxidoreductase [Paenibacillus spongiae]